MMIDTKFDIFNYLKFITNDLKDSRVLKEPLNFYFKLQKKNYKVSS